MPKHIPGNKLSPIFKSLQPDQPSGVQCAPVAPVAPVAPTAPALEAQQRWPLFKAITPVQPTAPPALTDEERQSWQRSGGVSLRDLQQDAAVPSLNEKLADGLGRLAGVHAGHQHHSHHTLDVPPPAPPHSTATMDHASTVPPPAPEPPVFLPSPPLTTPSLFPQPDTPPLEPAASTDIPAAPTPSTRGFSSIRPTLAVNHIQSAPDGTPQHPSESLKSLFRRLESPTVPITRSVAKKSSFLSRLGRR